MCSSTKFPVLLGLFVALFVTFEMSIAGPTLPYRAFATTPDIEVRSGAGEEYYVTGTIPENGEVEVHQHLVGGWLAIRPPEGSFSWVFGRHVKLIDPTRGRINKDNAPSRIGSYHHHKRQVIQVRFRKNEQIFIVGQEEQNGQLWYQIAPPSGEFRYVRARDLKTGPAIPKAPVAGLKQQAAENKGAGWIARISHDQPFDKSSSAEGKNTERPPTLAVSDKSSASPTAKTTAPQSDFLPPIVGASEEVPPLSNPPVTVEQTLPQSARNRFKPVGSATPPQPPADETPLPNQTQPEQDQNTSPAENASTGQSPATAANGPPTAAREFDPEFTRQLVNLDLQLSQAVVQQRDSWQLDDLKRQTEALLNRAVTVSEREAAQHVLHKINRFAEIQHRGRQAPPGTNPLVPQYGQMAPLSVAARTPQPASQPVAARSPIVGLPDISGTPPPRPASSRKRRSRYVAEGLLRPVVSRRPNAPQYALVDGTGKVTSFVKPTPDIDLKPFLGQRVGVVGRQTYLPELRQTLVTAGRVTPLDDASFRR